MELMEREGGGRRGGGHGTVPAGPHGEGRLRLHLPQPQQETGTALSQNAGVFNEGLTRQSGLPVSELSPLQLRGALTALGPLLGQRT